MSNLKTNIMSQKNFLISLITFVILSAAFSVISFAHQSKKANLVIYSSIEYKIDQELCLNCGMCESNSRIYIDEDTETAKFVGGKDGYDINRATTINSIIDYDTYLDTSILSAMSLCPVDAIYYTIQEPLNP